MALQTTAQLTYDDYARLPADGKRYEIIDGELYVNAAPVPRHQRIVRVLLVELDHYFSTHGGGEVFDAPLDVVLHDATVVQPDLLVIKSDRASIVREKNVQGAPNLIVEVLSDATRRLDEIDKRKLYERSGVEEYWIVDPAGESVTIYRRTAAGFATALTLRNESETAITSPLLPGFALAVRSIFP